MVRMSFLVPLLALLGPFLALVWLVGGDDAARADNLTVVGIDMNPTGNSCPGDDPYCALGPIHGCREVKSGDVIEFDVFLSGIPDGDSFLGFSYVLHGWPGVMTQHVHLDPDVNLICQPCAPFAEFVGDDGFDPTPPHSVSVGDFIAEFSPPHTQGVLGRYTLDLAGVAPDIYTMTLSDVAVGRDVPPGGALTIDEIWDGDFSLPYGHIAVDQLCPDADEDLWSDAEEVLIGTDRLDNCTDQPGDNDAWPPDINTSAEVNILDILMYKPVLNGPHDARYDLDTSGELDILDVLMFKPLLGASCAGP